MIDSYIVSGIFLTIEYNEFLVLVFFSFFIAFYLFIFYQLGSFLLRQSLFFIPYLKHITSFLTKATALYLQSFSLWDSFFYWSSVIHCEKLTIGPYFFPFFKSYFLQFFYTCLILSSDIGDMHT